MSYVIWLAHGIMFCLLLCLLRSAYVHADDMQLRLQATLV